jgi:polyisoprenoid-binding protein YceI
VRRLAAAAALAGGLLASADALAGMSVSGKPKVSFFAEGTPGALDIEGEAGTVTAADDGTTLTITVPMKDVHTGIDLRDEHMNEKFVQVAQFPNVMLAIKRADIQWPAELAKSTTGTVTGSFTAHGVSKDVPVSYTIQKSKTGYRVKAKFEFDVTQHGIEIPSYLGVTVDPKMRAEAQIDLADAP